LRCICLEGNTGNNGLCALNFEEEENGAEGNGGETAEGNGGETARGEGEEGALLG